MAGSSSLPLVSLHGQIHGPGHPGAQGTWSCGGGAGRLSALPRSHPGLSSPLPGVSGVVAGPAGQRGGIWGGVSPGAAPLPGSRTHRQLSLALPRGAALRVVVPAGGHPVLLSRVTTAAGLQDLRSSVPRSWLRIRGSSHLYSRSPAFSTKLSAATFPLVPARLTSVPLLPPCDTGTAGFRSQIRCTEVFVATTRQRSPFPIAYHTTAPLMATAFGRERVVIILGTG